MTDQVTGGFLQYGAIGCTALLALYAVVKLYGRITSNADAERLRADRAEQELRDLHTKIQDRVLVTLSDATHAIGDVVSLLRKDRQP